MAESRSLVPATRGKRLRLACRLLLLLCGASCPTPRLAADAIDRFIRSEMGRQQIPGLALAVVQDGRIMKAKGYGYANLEHRVLVTPSTVFQSGSIGKQFTAACILLLAEEGRLSLNDRLPRFFTNAPPAWQAITVRHLLSHTSGIPEYASTTEKSLIDLRRDYTEEELVAMAAGLRPEFAPGADWSYSNTGYVLLGAIIRKATGRFYGDSLRERIFQPLGMSTARIITEADLVPHRAAGYEQIDGTVKNQAWVAPSLNTTADGSLYLTVLDLARWDAGLRRDAPLPRGLRDQMWTPTPFGSGVTTSVKLKGAGYGAGWFVDRDLGHARVHHSGAWQGFKTHLSRYLEDGLTVIVLMNSAAAEPMSIANGVARRALPALRGRPIADTHPELTRQVAAVLAAGLDGKPRPEGIESGDNGTAPGWYVPLPALLKQFGAEPRPALLEATEQDGLLRLRYRVPARRQSLAVLAIFNAQGRLGHLGIEPE